MDCLICYEPIQRAGYPCPCAQAVICLACEAQLERCPFCRHAYPERARRMRAHGYAPEVIRAYGMPIWRQMAEAFESWKEAQRWFQWLMAWNFQPWLTKCILFSAPAWTSYLLDQSYDFFWWLARQGTHKLWNRYAFALMQMLHLHVQGREVRNWYGKLSKDKHHRYIPW